MERTLLLKVVATKAVTTTMETTTLTVVETVEVMLKVCLFYVDQCKRNEVSNYEMNWRKGRWATSLT
jgi:hypothetical protein